MVGSHRTRLITPEGLRRHIETDLPDEAVNELIDDADAAVVRWCGPHGIDGAVEEMVRGGAAKVFPSRAVETMEKVTETVGAILTELSADDYRIWHGGRTLERLPSGAHPRPRWADQVQLTYKPVDDDPQRRLAIIRLVQLGLQYEGVKSESVGPFATQYLDYTRERDAILKQLCPVTPI